MAITLLPKMIPNATGLTAATQRGCWIEAPFGELAAIANNLDVPKKFSSEVFVDAIPDIWGKALVFAYALREPAHQFHKQAVASFHGFLTMLALRVRRSYKIEVIKLHMSAANSGKFIQAVRKLLPPATLTPGLGWDPVYMFLLEDEVVGITSPLTLFAPREGADMRRAAARGLTDGFRFLDPLKPMQLTPDEARLVLQWVNTLKQATQALVQGADPALRTDITTALDDFITELREHAATVGETVEPAQDTLDLLGTYASLASAIGKAAPKPGMVELFAQKGPVAPKLLLIDEDTPNKWELKPTNVELINGLTMAAIAGIPLGNNDSELAGHVLPEGYKWIRPGKFLLDRLTVIKAKDAFVNVNSVEGASDLATRHGFSPLLPISERLAAYLQASYLERNCYFKEVGNGIEFTLQLPVSGGDRKIAAKQVYRFEDLKRVDGLQMPVMEIWPGFRSDKWKAYFTFWANNKEAEKLYIRPCGTSEQLSNRTQENRNGFTEVEVIQLEAAPDLLCCQELIRRAGMADQAPLDLGLLIPAYAKQEKQIGAEFQIGFDFGTTNTDIFLRKGEETPVPLELRTHTAQICRTDDQLRIGLLYRYFIPSVASGGAPAKNECAPFLSLLRRRILDEQVNVLAPVREAHVLYYSLLSSESDPLSDKNVEAHLKWSSTNNTTVVRKAFLAQLALHAALEAVREGATKLTFYYSYPTAYTPIMTDWFKNTWTTIVASLPANIGIDCALGNEQTESVAATYYFTRIPNDKALAGLGTLVVDIGGGTSDISIWRERKLEIQNSIHLSGREILLQPLNSVRSALIPKLCRGMNIDHIVESIIEADESMYYRRADALLKTRGEEIIQQLGALLVDPDYDLLRSQVSLRLGGLFYYMGLMLRGCAWKETEFLTHAYVGGNGCRILNWIAPPVYAQDHPIHGFLTRALAAGAGIKEPRDFKVIVSQKPKSEAACGLLYSITGELKTSDAPKKLIAGEPFKYGNADQPATTQMTAEGLSGKRGIQFAKAEELGKYLEVYNSFAAGPGAILLPLRNQEALLSRAAAVVKDWCQRQVGREDTDAMEIEPLFVIGLLQSLQMAEWKPRGNVTSV